MSSRIRIYIGRYSFGRRIWLVFSIHNNKHTHTHAHTHTRIRSTYKYSNGENWTITQPFGGSGPGTSSPMCVRNHTALRQEYTDLDTSTMTRSERNHLEYLDIMEGTSKTTMFLVCIYLFLQRFMSVLKVREEEYEHTMLSAEEKYGTKIEGLLKDARKLAEDLGLEWQRETKKPANGTEIHFKKLQEAIEKKILKNPDTDPIVFTKEDWNKFKVSNLSVNSYIKAGDRYFTPASRDKLNQELGNAKKNFNTTWQRTTHLGRTLTLLPDPKSILFKRERKRIESGMLQKTLDDPIDFQRTSSSEAKREGTRKLKEICDEVKTNLERKPGSFKPTS